MFNAVKHKLADDGVGIAERHALFDKPVCRVSSVCKAALCRRKHCVRPDCHGRKHICKYRQTHFYGIHRVKQGLLILLHILVVCQRKTLHCCQQTDKVSVNPSAFPTDKLRHIRIFLLRHNAGACGIRVRKLNKMEFVAAPKYNFFAETAQMHHQDRKRRNEFDAEIAVRNAVHTVQRNRRKAKLFRNRITVKVICCRCQRAAA